MLRISELKHLHRKLVLGAGELVFPPLFPLLELLFLLLLLFDLLLLVDAAVVGCRLLNLITGQLCHGLYAYFTVCRQAVS